MEKIETFRATVGRKLPRTDAALTLFNALWPNWTRKNMTLKCTKRNFIFYALKKLFLTIPKVIDATHRGDLTVGYVSSMSIVVKMLHYSHWVNSP